MKDSVLSIIKITTLFSLCIFNNTYIQNWPQPTPSTKKKLSSSPVIQSPITPQQQRSENNSIQLARQVIKYETITYHTEKNYLDAIMVIHNDSTADRTIQTEKFAKRTTQALLTTLTIKKHLAVKEFHTTLQKSCVNCTQREFEQMYDQEKQNNLIHTKDSDFYKMTLERIAERKKARFILPPIIVSATKNKTPLPIFKQKPPKS